MEHQKIDDVSDMIFHGIMNRKIRIFGLSVPQILVLKNWYERQTGKPAEEIEI